MRLLIQKVVNEQTVILRVLINNNQLELVPVCFKYLRLFIAPELLQFQPWLSDRNFFLVVTFRPGNDNFIVVLG